MCVASPTKLYDGAQNVEDVSRLFVVLVSEWWNKLSHWVSLYYMKTKDLPLFKSTWISTYCVESLLLLYVDVIFSFTVLCIFTMLPVNRVVD